MNTTNLYCTVKSIGILLCLTVFLSACNTQANNENATSVYSFETASSEKVAASSNTVSEFSSKDNSNTSTVSKAPNTAKVSSKSSNKSGLSSAYERKNSSLIVSSTSSETVKAKACWTYTSLKKDLESFLQQNSKVSDYSVYGAYGYALPDKYSVIPNELLNVYESHFLDTYVKDGKEIIQNVYISQYKSFKDANKPYEAMLRDIKIVSEFSEMEPTSFVLKGVAQENVTYKSFAEIPQSYLRKITGGYSKKAKMCVFFKNNETDNNNKVVAIFSCYCSTPPPTKIPQYDYMADIYAIYDSY